MENAEKFTVNLGTYSVDRASGATDLPNIIMGGKKMKRKGLSILAMVLIFALMAMPVSAAKPDPLPLRVVDTVETSENPANNYAANLMAGKDTPVGIVYIDAYEDNKYEVRYEITEPGWCLTEVHFEAINDGDDVFIENKGTLIPGKFTVKEKFELADKITEYSFKYESGADVIGFAAHAVVSDAPIGEMNGVIYGTKITGIKGLYEIDIVTEEVTLLKGITGGIGDVNNGTGYTNALAYDPEGHMLYFTAPSRVNVSPSPLWSYDIATDTLMHLCDLDGSVVSASFYEGKYYYIAEGINQLMKVDLNAGCNPVSMFSGFGIASEFTFGDFAISNSGMLYGSTRVATQMFFSLNLNSIDGEYNKYVGADALDLQLAYGSNGLLYGNNHGTADFFTIDVVTGDKQLVDIDKYAFADLASGFLFVPQFESAWGAGIDAETSNWSMIILIEDVVEGYYRWVEYEELSVPGISTAITESTTLTDGVEYKVEASGTYKFANWTDAGIADAVYSLRIVPYIPAGYPAGSPQWVDGADLGTPHEFWLQLWIDGANVQWVDTVADYIYTYELTGDGTSLEFTILDTSYGDNSGALTVIIYEWTWGW